MNLVTNDASSDVMRDAAVLLNVRIVDHPMEVWSRVHRWIDRALDSEFSLITAVDVFNGLLGKRMDLWGIWQDQQLVGAMVTQIEAGTRGRALHVIALGGDGMTDWLESLLATLALYAQQHGCRYIVEMGRPGWRRVLDKHGWTPGPALMLKVL